MPVVVLPFHDPRGQYLPHLLAAAPRLKQLFARAFVSLSPATETAQAAALVPLRADSFFCLNGNAPGSLPGDHYRAAYASAVAHCPPAEALHLCDVDKLVCYLHGRQRAAFAADMERASQAQRPVFFQRSPAAWRTYPRHYRRIEALAMTAAEYVFGFPIDIAWSHLVVRAEVLGAHLPSLTRHDFGLLPEVVLRLRDTLSLRPVSWMVWEDPFIYGRAASALRAERDADPAETRKRLQWLAPMLEVLLAAT